MLKSRDRHRALSTIARTPSRRARSPLCTGLSRVVTCAGAALLLIASAGPSARSQVDPDGVGPGYTDADELVELIVDVERSDLLVVVLEQ
jgi:hypothetical protein